MSSKDKTSDNDDATEATAADHTPGAPNDTTDTSADAPAEQSETDAQDAGNKDLSDVEDAVLSDEDAPAEAAAAPDEETTADADSATGPDGDSPASSIFSDPVSGDDAEEQTPQDAADAATGSSTFDPVEPSRTAAMAPPAPPPPAPQKSRGGFIPAVLGGLVAAGVGFGAAQFLDLGNSGNSQMIAAQQAKLSDLDAKLDAIAEAVGPQGGGGVSAQLQAFGDTLTTQFGDVAGEISGGLNALETRLANLGERMTKLEQTPLVESSEAAQQAFSSYEQDIENLRAELEAQIAATEAAKAEAQERVAQAEADIETAAEKAARLQAQAEEQARVAEEQAEAKARAAEIREAMASLDSYLQTGQPYGYALDILGEGIEVPAPLTAAAENGVITLSQLRDTFPDLARDALDASIREVVDDGVTDRIVAFFRAQTGVRSLSPREGDDPDAVLSRAEAALDAGDLSTTLSELGQLPPAGQQVMADWTEKAQTRLSVTEAADTLANTLLAN